jgi:hypothetical protein
MGFGTYAIGARGRAILAWSARSDPRGIAQKAESAEPSGSTDSSPPEQRPTAPPHYFEAVTACVVNTGGSFTDCCGAAFDSFRGLCHSSKGESSEFVSARLS